jgi:hypothetical protein
MADPDSVEICTTLRGAEELTRAKSEFKGLVTLLLPSTERLTPSRSHKTSLLRRTGLMLKRAPG